MNKGDLIAAVADEAGLSKVDGAKAVEAFMDVVKKALKKGDTVSLVGFGTFVVRSGVLTSVHSFAQSPLGPYFFSFLALSLVFSLGWLDRSR